MKRYGKYLSLAFLVLATPMLLAQSKDQQQPTRHLTSWTADRREYAVGDIITVLVSEVTLATAVKAQNGTDQQTRKNGMGFEPPKIGESSLPVDRR
jgi:flagellar basal body L-ring protein FlgH